MNFSSMGREVYCFSVQTITAGSSIISDRPPVTGPMTSFVAAMGSGWVQPLLAI